MGWQRLDRRNGHGEGERLGAVPCGSQAHHSLSEGQSGHLRVADERLEHVELSGGAEHPVQKLTKKIVPVTGARQFMSNY